ncbi:MAG TPA: ammonium transporter [Gemmataceae bacterium]|nr:ammonium transporter [Gemmataceae bacterium]
MKRFLSPVAAAMLLAAVAGPAIANDSTPADMTTAPTAASSAKLNEGDTAWMLVSTGLVLLMVPGLALFYGGMVRRKNVLGTMMHSMVALAIIGIQWLLFGYCLAFGDSQGGWIGWSPAFLGLKDIYSDTPFSNTHIPIYVHCMYQGMFAIITPALISGAVAERIKFGPYCLFILLWATLVYDPLAHWVWALDGDGNAVGWLGKLGALDFAGGTVVHIAAGLSGLAAIVVLRKRLGYPEHAMHPNSMVLTLMGAGLLWFGWFGFNGGSALGSNGLAGSALAASQVAAAAAALSWMLVEWLHKGKPTALGLASGLVAGLVAVTPASGFVHPLAAVAIGVAAGVVCYVAVCLKPFCKYDDSLDAFGVHGVGGFLGAILTGVFASSLLYNHGAGIDAEHNFTKPIGALADGRGQQLLVQLLAAVTAVVYAFGVSFVLVKVIDWTFGFCLDARAEGEGLDRTEHGEVGFDLGPALESVPEHAPLEPRAATVPPDGQKRFTVIVDGATNGDLIHAWSDLCQAGAAPPAPEFKAVYPYVTTVSGNRFRFRGGDPNAMRDSLQRLFQARLAGRTIKTHVEA